MSAGDIVRHKETGFYGKLMVGSHKDDMRVVYLNDFKPNDRGEGNKYVSTTYNDHEDEFETICSKKFQYKLGGKKSRKNKKDIKAKKTKKHRSRRVSLTNL